MGGGGDTTDTNMMQRVNSSSGTSSSSIPKHNLHLNPALIRSHHHFRHPFTGAPPPPIPPISPYSQIPATLQPRHSRSMSQPSSFFSFDSLPPLNPSAPSVSVSVEEKTGAGFSPSLPPSPFTMCHSSSSRNAGDGENLPPRKSHRRSNSDVTFGFSSMMSQNQKSPPLSSLERSISGEDTSDWSNLVKKEPREGFYKGRKPEVEAAMDDVFTAYMNLDNIDVLNSFGGEDGKNGNENVEEMESSRGSGTKKTNGGSSSDSEGDSSASGNVKVALSSSSSGVKRRAGGDIAPTGRHYRSVSMDSCFMGKLNFGDESSLKLPPSSSAKVSPTNSGEGNSSAYSAEDGTVKLWHSNTYRLESTLNYGLERCWTIACLKGSNNVALGYDEGTMMIKLGREEPAMSMDASTGKIVWAKHCEIQQVNLKQLSSDQQLKDGEKVPLSIKEMGSCEIYPQTLSHSPNGRFIVVCGDGEYIIYTAITLRNKSYGSAMEFVWSQDSSEYAVRDGNIVKLFKNFKEKKPFKPDAGVEGIFGGSLLGIRSYSGLAFYDWETLNLIRRIEIVPKTIYWSQNGELVCIVTEESYYVLRYNAQAVAAAATNKDLTSDEGIEDAFDALSEIPEVVKTGVWVGDCFLYTNSLNRINYYVGGEIVTISHSDRVMYLLGYVSNENRLYLGDKEMSIVSFELSLAVLEYQTAVMRKDFETADQVLPTIPKEQRTRVAHFLEKQGYRQQALAVTMDNEHKFDLALQLGNLPIAYELALEMENEQKWLQLGDVATKKGDFNLVQECLTRAQSFGSLLLFASANSDRQLMANIGDQSRKSGQFNIAFLSNFVLGKLDQCLDILIENQRLPEAAFFCRTYLPSQTSHVIDLWRDKLKSMNMERSAQALANPSDYENLFPGLVDTHKTEQFLKQQNKRAPARSFPSITPNWERNPVEEMREAENRGGFFYGPVQSNQGSANNQDDDEDDDDENFDDAPEVSKPTSVAQIKQASPINPPAAAPPTISKPPAMESSTISKLIPTDRERSHSPIKPPVVAPAPITTAAKPTTVAQKPVLSDLDKELQEFDIDLDKDDDVPFDDDDVDEFLKDS